MENVLAATRDHLRTQMSYDAKYINIEPGNIPPPWFGEFYITLDDGGVATDTADRNYLKEIFTVTIEVLRRAGVYPDDVQDTVYTDATIGLRALERAVIQNIHGNHTLRAAINTAAGTPGGSTGDIYQQPLWYAGRQPVRYENAAWNGDRDNEAAFIVRSLTFIGADRIQAISSMK